MDEFIASEKLTQNAFDSLYFLDQLDSPYVEGKNVSLQERINMYSANEEKYLQELKIKEAQAAEYRKKQIEEIEKQQGNDQILIRLGLQKRNIQQGHGISEEELQKMSQQKQITESSKQQEIEPEDESDDSFGFGKQSQYKQQEKPQEQNQIVKKPRRGIKLTKEIKKIEDNQ